MTFDNKLIRHWFGFAHGGLTMLGAAWMYEGKVGPGRGDAYFVLPLLAGIALTILVVVTVGSIVKEIEK